MQSRDAKAMFLSKTPSVSDASREIEIRLKSLKLKTSNTRIPAENRSTNTINRASTGTIGNRLSRTDSSPTTPSNSANSNHNFLTESYVPYKSTYKVPTPLVPTSTNKNVTGPALQDDFYNMNHKYRGRVVIFSHTNFSDGLESREGSEKDVANLKKQLPRLGYLSQDISVNDDLTFSEIAKTLVDISNMDFSDHDSLMIIVLTHGDSNDKIYAKDTEYSVEKLWRNFLGDRCPTLIGKPKMFFIIACRGSNTDPGVKVINKRKLSTTTDAAEFNTRYTYTIPVHADILTVYSTTPGFYSYREELRGTWYIEAFCEELGKLARRDKVDFIDFLTKVNLKLSTAYTTFNPEDMLSANKKQCSSLTSTLLRKITIEIVGPNQIKLSEIELF